MPMLVHPSAIGLYYNVNLFGGAGVQAPTEHWTLGNLVDAAQRLTVDTDRDGRPDRWGIATETFYYSLLCFLRSFGGEMLRGRR